jgi:hypothetical protein
MKHLKLYSIVLRYSSLMSILNSTVFRDISYERSEFLLGPEFLRELKGGRVQPALINAMCAVSARYYLQDFALYRFSIHPSLISQPRYIAGAAFANAAREQCRLDRPIFRLYIVQTLAILALYSFSINEGAQAWSYLGIPLQIISLFSRHSQPNGANHLVKS